jgi:uncharacterized membrane protein YbhN (UPF0104 family)
LNLSKTIRILIPSFLFLITTIYLLKIIPQIDLNLFSFLSYRRWLAIICLFFLVQLLNIYYFNIIISMMYNIDSVIKLSQVLFASHSFNYAGPLKLGIPVRLFLFKQILGIPYTAGIASLMATTGLDVLVMVALTISFSAWIFIGPLVGLGLGAAALICLVGSAALYQKLHPAPTERPSWLGRFFSELGKIPPWITLYCVLIATAKSLLNGFAGWIVLTGLGVTTSLVEFVFIYFASHLAGLLSLIPMGIGVKDMSIIELLSRTGAPASASITFVAVDRLVWSLTPLLIGLLAGWHLGVNALIRSADTKGTLLSPEKKEAGLEDKL